MKTGFITIEGLFDLIAPIHVYTNADVYFVDKAKDAFRKLKKFKNSEVVIEYFGEDIDYLKERKLDTDNYKVFWRVYTKLFKKLVLNQFPQFEATHDPHGAMCFEYEGKLFLDGDSYDCFPFYETSALLNGRLKDLKTEI